MITRAYSMKIYGPKSGNATNHRFEEFSTWESLYLTDVNIKIPHYDGSISAIEGLFNKVMANYLTGIYTDNFYTLNNAIPFGFYYGIGIRYPSPPYTPGYMGNVSFYFKDIRELLPIPNSVDEYITIAIASDSSDYYGLVDLKSVGDNGDYYWNFSYVVDYVVLKAAHSTTVSNQIYFPLETSGFHLRTHGVSNEYDASFVFTYDDDSWYYFTIINSPYAYEPYLECQNNYHGTMAASEVAAIKMLLGIPMDIDPYNPYPGEENAGEDLGGNGENDFTGDPTPESPLPTLSAVDTGFTRIFNPTLTQLKDLSDYMWTDTTFWDTLKNKFLQVFENPMEYMISLMLLPVPVDNGTPIEVKFLYIPTGVYMPPAIKQFIDVECGTCHIPIQFDSSLDNAPYTKIQLYLPYVGTVGLNADEVVGHTVKVKYRVDIMTGICCANVYVDDNVRYCYSGNCAVQIPFTSANFTTYISAALQAAKGIGSIAAAAGGNPALGAAIAGLPEPKSQATYKDETVTNESGAVKHKEGTTVQSTSGASFASIVATNISNTAGAIASAKPVIERSGTFSGNSGYLSGARYPFIIMESPNLCTPQEYGTYNGRPSMQYLKLSGCKGFTQIQQIVLSGFSATNPELDEIQSFLKSGVIL